MEKKKGGIQDCVAAAIDPPAELWEYFDYEAPVDSGVVIDIDIENHSAISKYREGFHYGFEVEIAKLDPEIKFIRFVTSD